MEMNRKAYAEESQTVLRKQQSTLEKLRHDTEVSEPGAMSAALSLAGCPQGLFEISPGALSRSARWLVPMLVPTQLCLQGRPSNKKIQKVPSYLLPLKIRKWGMESTFVPFLKIRKWELRTLPSRLKWLIARQKRNI